MVGIVGIIIVLLIIIAVLCYKHNQNSILVIADNRVQGLYFDNNATTIPPPVVQEAMNQWVGSGNPSGNTPAKIMIEEAHKIMKDHIFSMRASRNDSISDVNSPPHYLCPLGNPESVDQKKFPFHAPEIDNWDVIFTSGATESNSLAIRSAIENYRAQTFIKPHIIASSIEHKSIIDLLKHLEHKNACEYTLVEPDIYGQVQAIDVINAFQYNTILVTIMWANNEIGTINDVLAIANECRTRNAMFHTDATQIFGKYHLPIQQPIDAVSISFHKLYGPPGVGALIVHKRMKISSQIVGSQENGLRGGTENVPGIAGAMAALKYNFYTPVLENVTRAQKNAHVAMLRQRIVDKLSEVYPIVPYSLQFAVRSADDMYPVELVILGGFGEDNIPNLPNTLSLSFTCHTDRPFCNIKLKNDLALEKIHISIGSACNTSKTGPSHVLTGIMAPYEVACGTVRISIGDTNTVDDIDKLVEALLRNVKAQIVMPQYTCDAQ